MVTRYALHHFPAIEDTFKEIKRVLKDKGRLFISDPTPNSDDDERFVDDYMQMKKDGHIKYYTKYIYITQKVLNLLFEKSNLKDALI